MPVRISTAANSARVDYEADGVSLTEVFEKADGRVIRTSFNSDGEILDRSVLEGLNEQSLAMEFASMHGNPEKVEYLEIEVARRCPKCGSAVRYDRSLEYAVLPVFSCVSCKARSFSLTNEYLSRLVDSNPGMFDEAELGELSRDPGSFRAELRDYIIKIYASKHILEAK